MDLSMNCPGLSTESTDISMSGTVAYREDKTYQANVTVTGSVVMKVPASCLTQQGVTLTCGQLQQSLEAKATDGGYESVACSGSSNCSCTITLVPEQQVASGTYSTSGATLTQTEAGGTPEDTSYCVKGSSLTLSPTLPSVSGSVVLSKY